MARDTGVHPRAGAARRPEALLGASLHARRAPAVGIPQGASLSRSTDPRHRLPGASGRDAHPGRLRSGCRWAGRRPVPVRVRPRVRGDDDPGSQRGPVPVLCRRGEPAAFTHPTVLRRAAGARVRESLAAPAPSQHRAPAPGLQLRAEIRSMGLVVGHAVLRAPRGSLPAPGAHPRPGALPVGPAVASPAVGCVPAGAGAGTGSMRGVSRPASAAAASAGRHRCPPRRRAARCCTPWCRRRSRRHAPGPGRSVRRRSSCQAR